MECHQSVVLKRIISNNIADIINLSFFSEMAERSRARTKGVYLVFSLCRRQFTYLNTVELHAYLRQYTKSNLCFSPSRSLIMHWHFFCRSWNIANSNKPLE